MKPDVGQHLIIDADDTLWEHTVFYDRAKDNFCALFQEFGIEHETARKALDAVELANARLYGYGVTVFERSLQECYESLAPRALGSAEIDVLLNLAASVQNHPMEIIEGVPETLEYLSARHNLILFTKGTVEEQGPKIAASGLERWFGETVIAREKDTEAFRRLVGQNGLEPRTTWMVGNSPKSDINPALEAGLNGVYIPHSCTWSIENDELRRDAPGELLTLDSFTELTDWF